MQDVIDFSNAKIYYPEEPKNISASVEHITLTAEQARAQGWHFRYKSGKRSRQRKLEVVSNAAWKAPSGSLSAMFQAGALIELFGDVKTAFDIYYDNYDIHSLPPLK